MHFIWRYEFNEKHIIFYHTHHFFLLVFCCCYFRIGIRNCYHFSCYCDYFHLWILLFHQIASHGFLQVIFRWKLVGWVEPMNILTVILSISECNSKYYNGRKGRTDVVFSLANYAIFFLRVNHIDGAQFIFPLLFEFHLSSDFASIWMSLNKMNFLFVIATMYSYRIKVPTNFISSTRNRIFRLFE